MSETLHNRKLRLAAAEAMTSLALVGALAQPAEAKPDLAAGSEAAPARLISPDKLPGHNIRVSNETLNKLRGSTVVLGRQLGGDGRFGHWGTGVVVGELEDKVLVQVSAHQVLKNKEGYLNIPGKKAVDYFNLTADKFVIGDPTVVDAEQRMANPIGEVDAIAVSATANDAALLRVSRRSLPADGGAMVVVDRGGLAVVDTTGAVRATLGAAAHPIWSPLGQLLLYTDLNGVAPRVLITKFRTYTWFPRTDETIVPNTNGQWTEMQRGRHTVAGYDYVEVNLSVGPRSSSYIATQHCKTGWPTIN